MSRIIEPIHTAAVGIGNVRFFSSLLPGPQQPWHAWQDLIAATGLPRDLRRHLQASLMAEHRDQVKPVMTPDGPATLVPHFMGQGFIGAMEEIGRAPIGFLMAYTLGVTAAMSKIHGEMGLSDLDAMNHTIAAFRNSNGTAGPHPKLDECDVIRRPL